MDYGNMPSVIAGYLSYKLNIQGCSRHTIEQYRSDLCRFFKYIISKRTGVPENQADLSALDDGFADSVTTDEIYDFLLELATKRRLKPATRSRRLACIRTFYKFHTTKSHRLKNDPAKYVESPKKGFSLPVVMSLDEARAFLDSFDEADPYYKRNFLIALLFLNCGLRLSELVNIDLADIDPDMQRFIVRGKGGKTRTLYFNASCRKALADYLKVRQSIALLRGHRLTEEKALFLSAFGGRISPKTVQWMVNRQLELCGLAGRGYSVHKLRHTAATLMYNKGDVDIMMLKEILGHSHLNTTQIYTHVERPGVKYALEKNPLNVTAGGRQAKKPHSAAPEGQGEKGKEASENGEGQT